MQQLFFSVLVPVFKSRFLKECIDSVLSQTYSNFELIIVNDASPEDIDSIISIYSDDRLRYYKNKENIGAVHVVDNWNLCLSYAVGDYVICMGDDDKLLPNCLEEYSHLISICPGMGIYHGWTEIINENSNVIKMQEPRPLKESVYSLIWNRWLGRSQYIGDFLFLTSLLKENGGFYYLPLAWGSDNVSSYKAAAKNGIANTQIPVFQYRVNEMSISENHKYAEKMDAILGEKKWMSDFLKITPTNDIDLIYWKCIKDKEKKYYKILIVLNVLKDVEFHEVNIFKYWKKRHKYNLKFKDIVFVLLLLLKEKAKKIL
jgi:glycosyltransferase involved in cell wall biosynthesis